MLARLQQFITLGGLLAATTWAAWCWRHGHAAWGLAGAALIVGGYALVLGLEFVFLGLAHGTDDPTPRAGALARFAAWWDEVRAAPRVFCWRQPFRSRRWPDLLPSAASGRRGVLLVHGFVCNRGVWNRWLERLHAQQVPVVAVNLEPVFGSIDDYIPIIEAGIRKLEAATGRPPVVVAHSMGGLALRRWWAEHGDDARLHHAITVATPHHGTWLARFAVTPNAHQMRQRSPWLATLRSREPEGRTSRFTCFHSQCDNIAFPPATGTLPGADNRHLPGVPHVHMVDRPEPWDELQRWLRD